MREPHKVVLYLLSFALLAGTQTCSGGRHGNLHAQKTSAPGVEEEVKRGLELYQQGDDRGAIEALRRATKWRKDLITAWYYLGLAYERQGKVKDARQSYEKAAQAGEAKLEIFFYATPSDNTIDTVTQFRPLLLLAAESANKYLSLSPKLSSAKIKEWTGRAEMLREYAEPTGADSSVTRIYKPSEVTTKARILKRPEPTYTEEARHNQVAGTVVLRAILAFDGRVRGIRVVSGLPHGLTNRAVEAVRKIKFTPATLNGQPVSQFIQIEYSFNLY